MLTKLKELLRDLPLEEADIKKAWKTTLETIKTRLRNEIELLDKQIQDGEKRRPEKKQIEYDAEANALKQERDEKRKILDELVGKPELTDEQKIKKQETLLEKSIFNLQSKIMDGEIEYGKKPNPVTSAKIESLKKVRDSLSKELNQMRIDSGLAELKRLQSAKTSRLNRIKEYERRIAQKDFSVRKPKPLPIDGEILEIERNLQEAKAEYEKEKYKDELRNRSVLRKAFKFVMDALGITRLLKAFGELSPLFVQMGFITPRMLIRNPRALFKAIAMMGESIASPDAAERYEAQIKRHPLHPLMMKTKLSITGTDHRLKAGEEAFQLDLLNDTWNIAGKGLDALTNDKKVKTITGRIKSIVGKKLNESDYKTVGTQFKDSAPWKILERGTVVLSNQMKIAEFERGVKMLEMQGKDPINDISEYKKLASFINVFSGRASLGKAEQISKELGYFIFSVRNAVSQFQQLNPVFYLYTLGSKSQMDEIKKIRSYKDLKNVKPTVAQVMAVDNFMTSAIAIFTFQMAFIAWANRGTDDDEKWGIEFDPRSSDFMKMKKGGFTADMWHGLGSWVVLMSRIISGERKTAKGEINKLGVDTPTYLGTVQQFASNKLAPSWGYIYKIADTEPRTDERTGITYRVDQYGNVFGEDEFNELFYPIYWGAINEIRKTDPDKYEAFMTAMGFFGVGVGVKGEQKKFRDIVGGGEVKLPSMPSLPKLPKMP
jgi:hypothetical protein